MKRTIFICVAATLVWLQASAQNRPSSVSGDLASPSANIPPKKETMQDKVKRYEQAGYKIAVVFNLGDLMVQNPTSSAAGPSGMTTARIPVDVSGTEPACESCFPDNTDGLVEQLNAQFGTGIFEKVDVSQIPQKKIFGGAASVDDWWVTKYKSVVNVNVINKYEVTAANDNPKKVTAQYSAVVQMLLTEFVDEKNGKQDIIAQSARQVFGNTYSTEKAERGKWGLDDVRGQVGGPSEDDLTKGYASGYADLSKDFIDKVKKK
jgi:hypothetical protein